MTVSVDPAAGEIRRVLQGEADNKGRDKGGRERERERERERCYIQRLKERMRVFVIERGGIKERKEQEKE